jgi:hypothetical protein
MIVFFLSGIKFVIDIFSWKLYSPGGVKHLGDRRHGEFPEIWDGFGRGRR